VLHDCVVVAAHAPSPAQVPSTQVPLALHVCVSVPHLSQGIGLLAFGVQVPVHLPWLQT
jgi:hypothetical protein